LKGVIEGRAEYLNGENRYLIKCKSINGKPKVYWYTESALKAV